MNKNYYVEDETIRAELLRKGFEFSLFRELPQNYLAAGSHIHDAIEFIYVVQGSYMAKIDDNEVCAEEGDLLMFRSHGIHSLRTGNMPRNRHYVLKISTKLLLNLCPNDISAAIIFRMSVQNSNLKKLWKSKEIEESEILSNLLSMINFSKSGGNFSDVAIIGYLIGFVYGILKSIESEMRGLSSKLSPVYKSITYINSNYANDITAEIVARSNNISYSSFARMFKKATGKTFKEYLNVTRTNEAEILLKNTDYSITEVAMRCGYNNVSHFIATYKRYKGRTPLSER